MIYADGSSIVGLRGIGVIVMSLKKDIPQYGVQIQFPAKNNKAKYKATFTSLRITKALGVKSLKLRTNSELTVGQITNEYEVKEDRMKRYLKLTTNSLMILMTSGLNKSHGKTTQLQTRLLNWR